jgi:hypothetical protein
MPQILHTPNPLGSSYFRKKVNFTSVESQAGFDIRVYIGFVLFFFFKSCFSVERVNSGAGLCFGCLGLSS